VLSALTACVVLLPVALVLALLQLSTWRQRTRLAEVARQIAVTDAIHTELGAIVSPVVRRRLWGHWQLTIPVPFDSPDTVKQVIETAYAAFDAADRAKPGRFEIVLSPQEQPVPRVERAAVAARPTSGARRRPSNGWGPVGRGAITN